MVDARLIFLGGQKDGMIYINEWFSNPVGPDASGEFVELYNSAHAAAHLDGWSLKASAKKAYPLTRRTIAPRGYLLLMRSETKLALKNSDETLSLYDASGRLADQSSFVGAAPEGKSFSRINYGSADVQHFAFMTSTPDAANGTIDNRLTVRGYAFNAPLDVRLNTAQFFGMMMWVAVLLAALITYAIKTNDNVSQRLFGRDEETGS